MNDLSRIQTWVTLFLEPFLESVPQMIILTCLAALSPGIIMMQDWRLFWATYSSSILSSAFGISKFLMAGPTHLLAQEAPLGGFGSIGFLLLIVNITSTIVAKLIFLIMIALTEADFFTVNSFDGMTFYMRQLIEKKDVFIWLSLTLVPQLTYVSTLYNQQSIKICHICFCFSGHGYPDSDCWSQKSSFNHENIPSHCSDFMFLLFYCRPCCHCIILLCSLQW